MTYRAVESSAGGQLFRLATMDHFLGMVNIQRPGAGISGITPSVRAVRKTGNQKAGSRLSAFCNDARVLDGDAFYVNVT